MSDIETLILILIAGLKISAVVVIVWGAVVWWFEGIHGIPYRIERLDYWLFGRRRREKWLQSRAGQLAQRQKSQSYAIPAPVDYAPYQLGPDEYYHGTTEEAAQDIIAYNRWMIGESNPPAIWLTRDYSYAATQARKQSTDGKIVVVHCDPRLNLNDVGGSILHFSIPDAVPYQEYYQVPGITPVRLIESTLPNDSN